MDKRIPDIGFNISVKKEDSILVNVFEGIGIKLLRFKVI